MKVWMLKVNIDGFGGKLEDRFFYNRNDAIEALKNTSGFAYYEEDKKWDIEMMKECRVSESTDGTLHLRGIQYPKDQWDEYCIRWGEADLKAVEVGNHITDNKLYIIGKCYGYNTWLQAKSSMLTDYDRIDQRFDVLFINGSKNYCKKYARTRLRHLPRLWNNQEYEKEINFIDGNGRDYISMREFKIA